MIIFGYRGRDRTIGSGSFNCPNCRASRSYEHKKLQRWFTLYFVPIFPLQTLGERIVCSACNQAYTTAVLSYDPSQQEARRRDEILRQWHTAMIAIACAFGRPNEVQAEAVGTGMARIFQQQLNTSDILADCSGAPSGGMAEEEVLGRLADLPRSLAAVAKEDFLQSALDVLRAGSGDEQAQHDLLQRIGHLLGLSEAHVRGILATPA
ncbi:zinc-ribbon domain-containing protein [Labrys miyagiensis]|uniref:zinc-ribbon domain-containing protein n=1 Tax=Labrys miyagiensis TaxID=346912 RepID=UPI0024E0F3F7|nr:zinc-ribbon domain-containing protein [Labrys miyagiensis]